MSISSQASPSDLPRSPSVNRTASSAPSRRIQRIAAIFMLVMMSLGAAGVRAATPPAVFFPQDESPHNASIEWWYFTGHLTGTDLLGRTHHYGFELTFFRNTVAFPISGYAAHYAITDLDTGAFKYETRYSIQPDWIPLDGGFNIQLLDWVMSGKNGTNSLYAGNSDLSYLTTLNLNSSLPPALHGGDGLMTYGPLGTSYYYSRPNLSVSGSILDHGNYVQVSGQAWFDHQWGNFDTTNEAGWDWFSVQLDNGQEYMVYLIKDGNGTVVDKTGTLIKADGSTVDLDPSILSEQALSSWTSPHSGYVYSSGWTVTVPDGFLTVTPQVKDQELVLFSAPDGKYWEGATTVTGTINGQPVRGQGYTELTPPGYFKLQ